MAGSEGETLLKDYSAEDAVFFYISTPFRDNLTGKIKLMNVLMKYNYIILWYVYIQCF